MALQYLLAPTFQFVNTAGKPLSGGAYMEVYVHGTRTKYFCASDFNGTLHPFRIPLDSLGSNIVLANDTGSYDVYAYNRYGTLMMSRYNVKPGAGGGIGGTITSTDGSIDIHPTEDGVDLSVNGLDPSCLKVSADPRTTDGKFHFDTLVQEGDQAYVDNEGAIRLIKGWYHFTANVQLAWNAGARNETHQVTLYTTLSNSVIDFDISHVHTETIELSGDVSIAEDGSELVIGVSGMPTGLEASVIGMDVHAITGKDGHDKYYAGNGITISNENYIAADFDEVQEKLVAGSGVTIDGNVISAPSLVQVNSDWNATSGVAEILNKPDLDVFATKAEVNTGLASKQNTIPDLAAIRSGAQAGASAVQPADLANVATTGDYNSLNNRPNLTVYATKTEVNNGLATKQDVIDDLSDIRSGAQAGSTAVQPGDLATVATTGSYDDLVDKPSIPAAQVNSDWDATSGVTAILNRPNLATVATTGDYTDLVNKPSIPAAQVNADWDATSGVEQILNRPNLATVATTGDYNDLVNTPVIPSISVTDVEVDGTSVVNAQGVAEITMPTVPTKTSDLQNDSGFITLGDVPAQVNADWDSTSGASEILHKPDLSIYAQSSSLATVATTGDYDDLIDKPDLSIYAQSSNLATVATTGDYADLINTPSIPAAQVNADWDATSGVSQILNRPNLATVATTGSYSDLSNKPDLSVYAESANLATVATTGSYTDLSNTPSIPTATSDLTNDSGYITLSDVPAQVNADWDATSGAAEILNKPTIPSGTQLVPASTIADADKVLTVDAQGTPAWASAQAPISAGDGISITNDEISAKAGTGLEIADVSESTTDNLVCATMSSNWAYDVCLMTQALADIMNTSDGYTFTLAKPFDTYNMYIWPCIAKTSELNQGELQHYAFFGNYLTTSTPSTDGSGRPYEVSAGTQLTLKFSERDQFSTITVADILADLSSYSLVILWYDEDSPYAAETMLSTAMTPETTATHTTTTTLQDALCVKNPLPASTVSDADKVLTVDSQGTPAWASAQAPISAGNGIDITNNVVSVDTSVVATQTDLADKEDVFNVGTGLEMDTSGATPTLQVEAPVDIVAGPGIVIDNPDGNTLRVSVAHLGDWEDVTSEITKSTTIITGGSITFRYNKAMKMISLIGEIHVQGAGDVYTLPEKYRPQTNFTCSNPGATSFIDYTPSNGKFVARPGANGYFSWTMTMPCLGE